MKVARMKPAGGGDAFLLVRPVHDDDGRLVEHFRLRAIVESDVPTLKRLMTFDPLPRMDLAVLVELMAAMTGHSVTTIRKITAADYQTIGAAVFDEVEKYLKRQKDKSEC